MLSQKNEAIVLSLSLPVNSYLSCSCQWLLAHWYLNVFTRQRIDMFCQLTHYKLIIKLIRQIKIFFIPCESHKYLPAHHSCPRIRSSAFSIVVESSRCIQQLLPTQSAIFSHYIQCFFIIAIQISIA